MITRKLSTSTLLSPQEIGLSSRFSSFRSFSSPDNSSPSTNQYEIARQLAFSSFRFRGLCMPPGGGKSVVLVSSSLLSSPSRTLYLTVNKSLQNQLIEEHSDSDSGVRFFSLTGHSSYPCMKRRIGGLDFSSSASLDESECLDGPNCQYWKDVRESLSYPYVVTNIANWISIAKVGHQDRFGKFDYLILDEAHNLEEVLCSLLKIEVDSQKVDSLIGIRIPSVTDPLSIWSTWARDTISHCEYEIQLATEQGEKRKVKRLNSLLSDLLIVSDIKKDWIILPLAYPKRGASLTPVFASEYAERYLFRGIEDVILSSATLTKDDFRYLGINQKSFSLQDIDTGFDHRFRPFYYWPTVAVDYQMVEGQIRQLMNRIDRVIRSRSSLGWKGLIHSISYKHSKTIEQYSSCDLLTHNKDNFRSVLDNWLQSEEPDLIVSPVMQEGVDLKGDLCRYQIIFKNPTVDSRDPLVEARTKRDKKYRLYVAGKKIQQMVGRVYRGEKDAGETFIFDLHYGNWMQKAIEWPSYHKRAWKRISELPEPIKIP